MSELDVNSFLADLMAETGETLDLAPVAPKEPEPDAEPEPTDTGDPLRDNASIPEPVTPRVPTMYAERVEERAPTFSDVDAAEIRYEVEENLEPDTAPNPFGAAGSPSAPTQNADVVQAEWDADTRAEEAMHTAEQAAWNQPPPRDPYTLRDDDELYPGHHDDDDDDEGGTSRSGLNLSMPGGVGSLLEKPKEIFQKHPRPVIFGAIGLAVALVMGVAFGGGDPAAPSVIADPIAPPTVDDTLNSGTADERIVPLKVTAKCGAGQTDPMLAFDGDLKTAWICPRAHGIDGAIMDIYLKAPAYVKGIDIVPGFNAVSPNGDSQWSKYRVVTHAVWRLGGKRYDHPIDPQPSGSRKSINPPNGTNTASIRLTIQRTERPSAAGATADVDNPFNIGGGDGGDVDKAFAISEITLWGVVPE